MNAVQMLSWVEVGPAGWRAELIGAEDEDRPEAFTDAEWQREIAPAIRHLVDRGGGSAAVVHRIPRD